MKGRPDAEQEDCALGCGCKWDPSSPEYWDRGRLSHDPDRIAKIATELTYSDGDTSERDKFLEMIKATQ